MIHSYDDRAIKLCEAKSTLVQIYNLSISN